MELAPSHGGVIHGNWGHGSDHRLRAPAKLKPLEEIQVGKGSSGEARGEGEQSGNLRKDGSPRKIQNWARAGVLTE